MDKPARFMDQNIPTHNIWLVIFAVVHHCVFLLLFVFVVCVLIHVQFCDALLGV